MSSKRCLSHFENKTVEPFLIQLLEETSDAKHLIGRRLPASRVSGWCKPGHFLSRRNGRSGARGGSSKRDTDRARNAGCGRLPARGQSRAGPPVEIART